MESEKDPKSISRRRFLSTAATAIGGLTLAACGGGTTGGAAAGETAAPAGEAAAEAPTVAPTAVPDVAGKTNISVWFWADAPKGLLDAFHAQNPNINVKWEKQGFDDAHKKLLTSFAAGSGAPDVAHIEVGYIGSFTARGGLVNMLEAPFDAGQFKEGVVPYKWAQASTADGRLVAMPTDIAPGGLWYRADILQEAGFETDPEKMQARIKTWDDWLQLADDLKKKNPNTSLFADAFQDLLQPMVNQQGQGWFEGNKLMFEEKGLVPLQRAVDARKRGLDANIDWWGADFKAGMQKKAIGGMGVAAWMAEGMARDYPETAGQWRVIHAPEGDYNMGGSFAGIPEQSQNKEAAWEFIKFYTATVEGQNAVFKSHNYFPSYMPAWEDPLYDQPVEFYGGQKAYRLWLDVAKSVPAVAIHPNDRQASDIVGAEITKVEKEGKDPAQAMKDAEAEALKRIKEIEA